LSFAAGTRASPCRPAVSTSHRLAFFVGIEEEGGGGGPHPAAAVAVAVDVVVRRFWSGSGRPLPPATAATLPSPLRNDRGSPPRHLHLHKRVGLPRDGQDQVSEVEGEVRRAVGDHRLGRPEEDAPLRLVNRVEQVPKFKYLGRSGSLPVNPVTQVLPPTQLGLELRRRWVGWGGSYTVEDDRPGVDPGPAAGTESDAEVGGV